jgi:hypothetical protein
MRNPLLLAAIAIAALGLGAVAAIRAATAEVGGARNPAALGRSAAPPQDGPALPSAWQEPRAQQAMAAPARPTPTPPPSPPPVPSEAPVIGVGPSPLAGLPSDEAAREDAIEDARRQRFSASMDALDRRNAARVGAPPPSPPETAMPPPGAMSSRRGALSGSRRSGR